jgi:hypothetical protein
MGAAEDVRRRNTRAASHPDAHDRLEATREIVATMGNLFENNARHVTEHTKPIDYVIVTVMQTAFAAAGIHTPNAHPWL